MAERPPEDEDVQSQTSAQGGLLFSGQRFWIAQKIPSRSHYIERIRANGGAITAIDKDSEAIRIVDHVRKDLPPGCYSFKYVDLSLRNGRLERLEDHLVQIPGGKSRSAGSLRPTKSTRTPFTTEDDQLLLHWVDDAERSGARVMGNEIYKQLEQENPRHPWQAWRDRYCKVLLANRKHVENERPAKVRDQKASQINGHGDEREDVNGVLSRQKSSARDFTNEEHQLLRTYAAKLSQIPEDALDKAWKDWSELYPEHGPEEWREFFDTKIRSGPNDGEKPQEPSSTQYFDTNGENRQELSHGEPVTPGTHTQSLEVQLSEASEPPMKRRRSASPLHLSVPRSRFEKFKEVPASPDQGPVELNNDGEGDHDLFASFLQGNLPVEEDEENKDEDEEEPPSDVSRASPSLTDPGSRARPMEQLDPGQDQDTQAILTSSTQVVDFDVPAPPGGWEDEEIESGQDEEDPGATQPEASKPETVESWITSRITPDRPAEQVYLALKCTSFHPVLADSVLSKLPKSKSNITSPIIPSNMRGVWTDEDDAALKEGTPGLLKRLERRHGQEGIDRRRNFLMAYET